MLPNLALALSVTPNTWVESGNSGTVLTKTFTFTAGDSETVAINLTKTGDINDWIIINPASINIFNGSSTTVSIIAIIPSDANTGTYTETVSYFGTHSGTIPLTFSITNIAQENCMMLPFPSVYQRAVQQGTTATKQISILANNYCTAGITIKDISLTGDIIETDEGTKPIRIEEASLGTLQPLQESTFKITFDARNVETGTYTAVATITALNLQTNDIITSTVRFTIIITAGVTPATNMTFTTLPTCTVPSQLNLNNTYKFICDRANPNLRVSIEPNEYLEGLSLDELQNQIIWNFKPIKIGNTELKYAFKYKDAVIGTLKKAEIIITAGGSAVLPSGNLTLEFFPKLTEITDGSTLNILCRDSVSHHIIEDCSIYVNGVKMKNQTIQVASGEYFVSALAPNYRTVDINFTTPKKKIKIVTVPEGNFEVGDSINIICKDSVTNENLDDCSIFWDNLEASPSFIIQEAGNHTVLVKFEGYESDTKIISVTTPTTLLEGGYPKEIYLNKNATILLTKKASWSVKYKKNVGSLIENYVSGEGDKITFTPDKPGIYSIIVKGMKLKDYEVKGGFNFDLRTIPYWVWVAIIIVAVAFFLLRYRKTRRPIGYGVSSRPLETIG
jgi:hypothetical protein